MKRLALTIATLLLAFAWTNAQYKMVVETNDGISTSYWTTDIKNITWQYSEPDEHEKHEYVDLGLSVKWATCNLGATTPEGYGDYFAWGETSAKKSYFSWSNLKYCNDASGGSFSKYNQTKGGTRDSRTVLELSDDAAHANWGGDWRMPTKAEIEELLNRDNCTWTWTTQNGVKGYKVVSKVPGYAGNSIFLPAAGFRDGTYLFNADRNGIYWSSSLCVDYSDCAWLLFFNSDSHNMGNIDRYEGLSVRPVFEEKISVTGVSLNKKNTSLTVGCTETLTATISPYNASEKSVTWSSSDSGVATVDQSGKVTAINEGIATITVSTTDGDHTATCVVVVRASGIIFKEVYYMGVLSYYFHDAFYELVNNSNETQYLDGIIITFVEGGSWGTPSPWADAEGNLPDFYPSESHVMAFPGTGKDYPLEPGKSVVLAAKAIDHSSRKLSSEDAPSPVDLSHADWDLYVEGSPNDIDNPDVPNMLFLYKCGSSNEFMGPIFGASIILAKLPEGQDLYAFAADSSNIKMYEGGYKYALCIPAEYCIDAIQIPSYNKEGIMYPSILPKDDAGYALYTGSDDGEWTSASYTGRSLRRKCMLVTPDRVFYQDTNNSANDFITIPTPTPGVHPTVAD